MSGEQTNDALALRALGWTLADDQLAERFLALTGLTPQTLRARLQDPALLAGLLHVLEQHEPDLLACAAALDVEPAALVEARQELEA